MQKRERSSNFSLLEINCLVDLIMKYSKMVENKRTDALSWKEKEIGWSKITEEFNSRNLTERSVKTLKMKYDGLKKALKKKKAHNTDKQYKTGGGTQQISNFTEYEKRLLPLIFLSAENLPNTPNSDDMNDLHDTINEDTSTTSEIKFSEYLPEMEPSQQTDKEEDDTSEKEESNFCKTETSDDYAPNPSGSTSISENINTPNINKKDRFIGVVNSKEKLVKLQIKNEILRNRILRRKLQVMDMKLKVEKAKIKWLYVIS